MKNKENILLISIKISIFKFTFRDQILKFIEVYIYRQASLVTPSRKRYFIMVLLFITVVINYLDRSNLSIGPGPDRHWASTRMVHVGLIFSAFGWTYAAMQIPGGCWSTGCRRASSTPWPCCCGPSPL